MNRTQINDIVLKNLEEIEQVLSDESSGSTYPDGLPLTLYRCLSMARSAIPAFAPPEDTVELIVSKINAERDRRIDGGFVWNGISFQSRPSDRENIMGAAQLAMAYLGAGGDPLSLRWADPEADFVWIAADNKTVPMTAADVCALFQAGVEFKSALTFCARAMKDAVIAAEEPASVPWRDNWP